MVIYLSWQQPKKSENKCWFVLELFLVKARALKRMLFIVFLLLSLACAADVPQNWSGCDAVEFSMMLVRSHAYYRSGLFELSDSERVSRILENREVMKEICPVALLQAILLKLEENLVYQSDAFQSLMAQYTLYLHEAIRNGKISSDDLISWPLDEGVQRAMNISKALGSKRSLSSAIVMNYCQVVDRFGTSHELDWILAPPFGESFVSSTDVGDTGLLTDTDFYIYQVDWPWCQPLKEEVLVKVRRAVRNLHVINYSAGPRREEQTAYFKYIADHWERLPDFTIFVHPDADEHQGAQFLALRRALKLIKTQSQFAYEDRKHKAMVGVVVDDLISRASPKFCSVFVQNKASVLKQRYRFLSLDGTSTLGWKTTIKIMVFPQFG